MKLTNTMYLRHVSYIFIFLLLTCSFCDFAYSFPASNSHKKIIKIGYHAVPSNLYAETASIENQRYFQILKEMEKKSCFTFEFKLYSFEDGMKALENNEIDIFGPIHDQKENTENLTLGRYPIDYAHVTLAFKNDQNFFYNDLSSIEGKTIATYPENPYNQMLNDYLDKNKIYANFVYGPENIYHQLKADFYLSINKNENFDDFLSIYNLSLERYYFAALNENKYLIHELDQAFSRVVAENGSLIEDLFVESIKNTTSKRYLTKQEMQRLKESTFSVGYTSEHNPIQFTNENGQPDGISIDILNLLSKQYGFKINYHGYNPEKPDDRKEYDILLAAQDVIPDLYDNYIPSNAYVELPLIFFLRESTAKENAELNKHLNNVILYNYIGFDPSELKEKYSNPNLKFVNSINEAATAYFSGQFDAGLFTITASDYITSLVGSGKFRVMPTSMHLPLRLYINKKLPYEFVDTFNLLIEHLDQSELNLIVSQQTVKFTPEFSLIKFIITYKGPIILIIFIIALSVMMFIAHGRRKEKQAVLNALNHDELTDLPSYYYFIQQSSNILKTAKENEYTLVSIDIDHYSLVSKFYGYNISKDVIILMANTLRHAYNSDKGIICRVSAEHFIFMHKTINNHNLEDFFENTLSVEIRRIIGEKFCLSLSVGVCTIKDPSEAIPVFIDRANLARVKGKHLHKNTYHYFDNVLQTKYERQALIVSQMEKAIQDRKFYLCYQPKVDLDSLKIHGAEALVRWHHIDGTTIYPDEFITTFESNGFIEILDLYVFENVCKMLAENSKKINIPTISINLSSYTIKNPETPNELLKLLKKYNIEAKFIEIEITESALIDDNSILLEQVENLKNIGFTISLDDFGSGVSTLNRLASINVDVVKLDKLFLDCNINEKKGSIVVESVIRLTKDLQMQVVCEGVETAQQVLWLKDLQCNLVQGYFFDKPLIEEAFLKILQEDKAYTIEDRTDKNS